MDDLTTLKLHANGKNRGAERLGGEPSRTVKWFRPDGGNGEGDWTGMCKVVGEGVKVNEWSCA